MAGGYFADSVGCYFADFAGCNFADFVGCYFIDCVGCYFDLDRLCLSLHMHMCFNADFVGSCFFLFFLSRVFRFFLSFCLSLSPIASASLRKSGPLNMNIFSIARLSFLGHAPLIWAGSA